MLCSTLHTSCIINPAQAVWLSAMVLNKTMAVILEAICLANVLQVLTLMMCYKNMVVGLVNATRCSFFPYLSDIASLF
jgi:hypothetical protein